MAGSLAKSVLKRASTGKSSELSGSSKGGRKVQDEALRTALNEAYAAVKEDNFDGFAVAFEAALDIHRDS